MAKYWDQILSLLAWGTAFVLFFLGVRKLFQGENALKRRGRFALYVALALALMGWRELPAEETKTPAPKEVQQPKAVEDAVKNTDEWKAFAKFWRNIGENKQSEPVNTIALREHIKALNTLVEKKKLDGFSVKAIESACGGFFAQLEELRFDAEHATSRAMPASRHRFSEGRNTLFGIRQVYNVRGVLNEEQRTNLATNIKDEIKRYDAESQYLKMVAISDVLGGYIYAEDEYFAAEREALDTWAKESLIDPETARKIKSDLDRVEKMAAVTRDLLKDVAPPVNDTAEFKILQAFWKQLDAISPKPTKSDYSTVDKNLGGIKVTVQTLARKGCISTACAKQINQVINMRVYVFGEAVSGHYRLTPELDARMTKIDRYNVQLAAINKLKALNKVDEKALKAAQDNANKILATYLIGDMMELFSTGYSSRDALKKYVRDKNQPRSYQPKTEENKEIKKVIEDPQNEDKQIEDIDNSLTCVQTFQNMRNTLDDLLKQERISRQDYLLQKQKLHEVEQTFSEVNSLVQKLRE